MSKLSKLLGILLVISLLALPLMGCAKEALTMSLYEPKDGASVTASPVTVRGFVSDAKAVAWVNDTAVTVAKYRKGGGFSTKVELAEGENTIKCVAARGKPDKWKEMVENTVTVTFTPPLSLKITSPEAAATLTESPVAVSGTVSVSEATITVNGMHVEVVVDNTFSADVELTEGLNRIEVVATRGKEVVTRTVNVFYSPE